MKQIIRLTESQLHNFIGRCVSQLLEAERPKTTKAKGRRSSAAEKEESEAVPVPKKRGPAKRELNPMGVSDAWGSDDIMTVKDNKWKAPNKPRPYGGRDTLKTSPDGVKYIEGGTFNALIKGGDRAEYTNHDTGNHPALDTVIQPSEKDLYGERLAEELASDHGLVALPPEEFVAYRDTLMRAMHLSLEGKFILDKNGNAKKITIPVGTVGYSATPAKVDRRTKGSDTCQTGLMTNAQFINKVCGICGAMERDNAKRYGLKVEKMSDAERKSHLPLFRRIVSEYTIENNPHKVDLLCFYEFSNDKGRTWYAVKEDSNGTGSYLNRESPVATSKIISPIK